MGYLNDTLGAVGGYLPAPHDSVRIQVRSLESGVISITYQGPLHALRASGAIDALMARTIEFDTAGRDLKLRPFTAQYTLDGLVTITRNVASIKTAAELPGIRGSAMHLSSLGPRKTRLRPV